jgi:hypothetical protein
MFHLDPSTEHLPLLARVAARQLTRPDPALLDQKHTSDHTSSLLPLSLSFSSVSICSIPPSSPFHSRSSDYPHLSCTFLLFILAERLTDGLHLPINSSRPCIFICRHPPSHSQVLQLPPSLGSITKTNTTFCCELLESVWYACARRSLRLLRHTCPSAYTSPNDQQSFESLLEGP